MVAGANVLPINSMTNETITPDYCSTNLLLQINAWLASNPVKRPQYVILFPDVPSRVNTWTTPGDYGGETNESPSVQVEIATLCATNWSPFVTAINFNTTNDCAAYIDKLASFGSNYSPQSLVISPSLSGLYDNTNYIVDNVRSNLYAPNQVVMDAATNALLNVGVSPAALIYANGTNPPSTVSIQITTASNIAAYISWGSHSSLAGGYPTNGAYVWWSGQSSWWILETFESYNGVRFGVAEGNFDNWFESDSFGGSNYSTTPVGAVSNVDEPQLLGNNNPYSYFGLWASGRNFAQSAWISRQSPELQVVGDPFIKR